MAVRDDTEIISLSFRPDGITEVTYAETRDKTLQSEEYRTLMFDNTIAKRYVDEILESTQDLIDVVKSAARNDPETK